MPTTYILLTAPGSRQWVVLALLNIVAMSVENSTNCLHNHGNVVFGWLAFLYLKNLTSGVEPRGAAFVLHWSWWRGGRLVGQHC